MIYIIALFVVVLGACLILCRAAARKEQVMLDILRRRRQDYDREDLANEKFQ